MAATPLSSHRLSEESQNRTPSRESSPPPPLPTPLLPQLPPQIYPSQSSPSSYTQSQTLPRVQTNITQPSQPPQLPMQTINSLPPFPIQPVYCAPQPISSHVIVSQPSWNMPPNTQQITSSQPHLGIYTSQSLPSNQILSHSFPNTQQTPTQDRQQQVLQEQIQTPHLQQQTSYSNHQQYYLQQAPIYAQTQTSAIQQQSSVYHNQLPSFEQHQPENRVPLFAQSQLPQSYYMGQRDYGMVTAGAFRMKEIADIIPEFNPSNISQTAQQFVDRINILHNAYQWNETMLILAVQTKLKGNAKVWNDSLQIVFNRWCEFSAQLLANFTKYRNEADIHMEMMASQRLQGEKIEDFFHRVCALGRKNLLSEAAIIQYIRNGLHHSPLQNSIAGTQFASTIEMHKVICRFLTNVIVRPVNTTRNQSPLNNNNALTEQRNNQRKSDVCYNCFEPGHQSLQCPRPQRRIRCDKCLRTGHSAKECRVLQPQQSRQLPLRSSDYSTSNQPSVQRANRYQQNSRPSQHEFNKVPPSTEENIRQIAQNKENTIRKEIIVNKIPVMSFVDPGSDRSLIRECAVEILDTSAERCTCTPVLLKGFGGGSFVCNQKLNAQVEIDEQRTNGSFYIVKNDMIPEDILLGADMLCQSNLRVIFESGTCRVEEIKAEDINIGETITPDESSMLKEVVKQFSSCFTTTMAGVGKAKDVELNIELSHSQPINCRPYRVPFAKRETVNNITKELLQQQIIRSSSSPYASPIVLVKKHNGEDRMCIDYRQLNRITVKQPFPMPIIEEHLASLSGNVLFTTLDLMAGYYQIPVAEESKKYTAFITNDGHYEFNRMPFGLVNGPSVFQNMINRIIKQMEPDEAMAYIDDIIIPSKTVDEGLYRLKKILTIIQTSGMTLRISKCAFLMSEIAFLGHRITKNGIYPGEEKTDAIKQFKRPQNVHELRRFLGLTGFFRKFVRNFADISRPLTNLLKINTTTELNWNDEHTFAFEQLKTCLIGEPVLALYDRTKNHEVHTDASATGLAGVLMQRTSDKILQPVFYFSRHNNETEQKYHSYELEVLAIVESLERFRVYLLGKHFQVVTDCAAVSATKVTKPLLPRVARWWLKLQEFDFEVIHRPAAQMQHADALSRAPFEPSREVPIVTENIFRVEINQDDWLATMQHQDPKLHELFEILAGRKSTSQTKKVQSEFKLVSNRLFHRTADNELKWVVPSAVRWRILKNCHDDRGHFGVEKTIQKVTKDYWFPRIRNYVKKYISACVECCYNKRSTGKPESQMYIGEFEPIPFRVLHVDHLGPFVKSKKGNSYIIGVSDPFSKYLILKAVRNTSTTPVINMLSELTTYFGLPERIVTDRGTAYTSKLFKTFCTDNNIVHIKNAVRTPRANGQIERANSTILSFLRTTTDNPKNWDAELKILQWTVNSQQNSTTGFSPNEIVFDFHLKDIVKNRLLGAIQSDEKNQINMAERRIKATENIKKEKEKWKKRFDMKHKKPTTYEEGDIVVIENIAPATGESRKLEPLYRGPYVVSKVLGRDRYQISDVDGMPRNQRKFQSTFTSERMKPWCELIPDIEEEENDNSDEEAETSSMSGRAECQ